MSDKLPEFIDPVVFAERDSHLHGYVSLKHMQRLAEFLFDQAGELQVDLRFYKKGKVPTIEGHIEGYLNLTCQRCLQSLKFAIDRVVKIGMVQTLEQADQLDGAFEPLIITDRKISLSEIIEDELLISLPDFPRHEFKCLQYEPDINKDSEQKSDNPFAVLASLKNTGDH